VLQQKISLAVVREEAAPAKSLSDEILWSDDEASQSGSPESAGLTGDYFCLNVVHFG